MEPVREILDAILLHWFRIIHLSINCFRVQVGPPARLATVCVLQWLCHGGNGLQLQQKSRNRAEGGVRTDGCECLRKARTWPKHFSGIGIEGARSSTRAQYRRPTCSCGLEQKKGRIHSPGCPLQFLPARAKPSRPGKPPTFLHQPCEVPQTVPWNIFDLPCQCHVYLVVSRHLSNHQYEINFQDFTFRANSSRLQGW